MDSKRPKIYKRTHGNSSTEIQELDREDGEEMITDANRDTKNRHDVRTETENSDTATYQTFQHSGSVCVKIRSSRAALVCLVLLCVLLPTAVIVLAIKLSKTVDEFYIKYKNITEEIKELKNKKSILEKTITNLPNYYKTLNRTKWTLQNETEELRQKIHKMDGWTCYQSSLYFISTEKKSWIESRRYCTDRGADLVIINNKEEQEYLKRVPGGTDVWIGLTDSDVENTWKWVDGTNMTSGFWRDGEPSDSAGDKDCAINLPSGFADYSYGWKCYQSSLYYISSDTKNWADSREDCLNRGADLIIINNKEEQESFKTDAEYWIGLNDSDVEGTWKWVDGSTLTSGFWASGQPNMGKEQDCAVLYSQGWYDHPCNYVFKRICERKAS